MIPTRFPSYPSFLAPPSFRLLSIHVHHFFICLLKNKPFPSGYPDHAFDSPLHEGSSPPTAYDIYRSQLRCALNKRGRCGG